MRRGILGIVSELPQALMDKINAAAAAGANAQTAAQQAQATANAAQTASQAADTAANNLSTAVAAGNTIHTDLSNRITALENKVQAIGTGRIAVALILGGTVDVVVTLSRTMPNNTYTVQVAPTAGFTFGTPKAKTATTVTIPVTAGLALAVGASFQVLATG